MTGSPLLDAGVPLVEMGLAGALLRGVVSALGVWALLLAARRWGRDLAGLLAGLPTVTGPAMVWLALDRGSGFAGAAAHGAVLAAVPCALFALGYARLAPARGRWPALAGACGASVLALLLLVAWNGSMTLALALAALTCAACLVFMPRASAGMGQASGAAPPRLPTAPGALRSGLATVLVSGAVSTLVSLCAQALDPHWAGVLTSPPLVAAAVVLELHRQGCPVRVREFLRGYTAGLVGRSVFVAVFGALLVPQGLASAIAAALSVSLLLGWASLAWMQGQGRLALLRSPRP